MTVSFFKLSKKGISTKSLTELEKTPEQIAIEFWKQMEAEASELEVTLDYYLSEFFTT